MTIRYQPLTCTLIVLSLVYGHATSDDGQSDVDLESVSAIDDEYAHLRHLQANETTAAPTPTPTAPTPAGDNVTTIESGNETNATNGTNGTNETAGGSSSIEAKAIQAAALNDAVQELLNENLDCAENAFKNVTVDEILQLELEGIFNDKWPKEPPAIFFFVVVLMFSIVFCFSISKEREHRLYWRWHDNRWEEAIDPVPQKIAGLLDSQSSSMSLGHSMSSRSLSESGTRRQTSPAGAGDKDMIGDLDLEIQEEGDEVSAAKTGIFGDDEGFEVVELESTVNISNRVRARIRAAQDLREEEEIRRLQELKKLEKKVGCMAKLLSSMTVGHIRVEMARDTMLTPDSVRMMMHELKVQEHTQKKIEEAKIKGQKSKGLRTGSMLITHRRSELIAAVQRASYYTTYDVFTLKEAFWANFMVMHPFTKLHHFDLRVSAPMRALLIAHRVYGACALLSLYFLNLSGECVTGKSAFWNDIHEPIKLAQRVLQNFLISIACFIAAWIPMKLIERLARKRRLRAGRLQKCKWRCLRCCRCLRMLFAWLIAIAYILGCLVLCLVFLATAESSIGSDWLLCVASVVLCTFVLYPALKASCKATFTLWVLTCSSEAVEQAQSDRVGLFFVESAAARTVQNWWHWRQEFVRLRDEVGLDSLEARMKANQWWVKKYALDQSENRNNCQTGGWKARFESYGSTLEIQGGGSLGASQTSLGRSQTSSLSVGHRDSNAILAAVRHKNQASGGRQGPNGMRKADSFFFTVLNAKPSLINLMPDYLDPEVYAEKERAKLAEELKAKAAAEEEEARLEELARIEEEEEEEKGRDFSIAPDLEDEEHNLALQLNVLMDTYQKEAEHSIQLLGEVTLLQLQLDMHMESVHEYTGHAKQLALQLETLYHSYWKSKVEEAQEWQPHKLNGVNERNNHSTLRRIKRTKECLHEVETHNTTMKAAIKFIHALLEVEDNSPEARAGVKAAEPAVPSLSNFPAS